MKARWYFTLIALLTPSAVMAADLLPLMRGIYVAQGSNCRGASNVEMVNYWGDNAGIGNSWVACSISNLRRNGTTYTFMQECESVRPGGGAERERVSLRILSRTSFVRDGVTYRYCGREVQF